MYSPHHACPIRKVGDQIIFERNKRRREPISLGLFHEATRPCMSPGFPGGRIQLRHSSCSVIFFFGNIPGVRFSRSHRDWWRQHRQRQQSQPYSFEPILSLHPSPIAERTSPRLALSWSCSHSLPRIGCSLLGSLRVPVFGPQLDAPDGRSWSFLAHQIRCGMVFETSDSSARRATPPVPPLELFGRCRVWRTCESEHP